MERALSVMMTCRLNDWSFFTILRDGVRDILTGTPQDLSQYDEPKKKKALEERKLLGLT